MFWHKVKFMGGPFDQQVSTSHPHTGPLKVRLVTQRPPVQRTPDLYFTPTLDVYEKRVHDWAVASIRTMTRDNIVVVYERLFVHGELQRHLTYRGAYEIEAWTCETHRVHLKKGVHILALAPPIDGCTTGMPLHAVPEAKLPPIAPAGPAEIHKIAEELGLEEHKQ